MATKKIIVKTRSAAKKPKAKTVKQKAEGATPVTHPPASESVADTVARSCLERVFQRLTKLAALPAAAGRPLLTAEAMYEHNLFTIQEYLKHVLEATALTLGPSEQAMLRERFSAIDWNF